MKLLLAVAVLACAASSSAASLSEEGNNGLPATSDIASAASTGAEDLEAGASIMTGDGNLGASKAARWARSEAKKVGSAAKGYLSSHPKTENWVDSAVKNGKEAFQNGQTAYNNDKLEGASTKDARKDFINGVAGKGATQNAIGSCVIKVAGAGNSDASFCIGKWMQTDCERFAATCQYSTPQAFAAERQTMNSHEAMCRGAARYNAMQAKMTAALDSLKSLESGATPMHMMKQRTKRTHLVGANGSGIYHGYPTGEEGPWKIRRRLFSFSGKTMMKDTMAQDKMAQMELSAPAETAELQLAPSAFKNFTWTRAAACPTKSITASFVGTTTALPVHLIGTQEIDTSHS